MKKIFFITILLVNTHLLAQLLPIEIEYGKEYFPLDKNIELIFDSTVGEMVKTIQQKDSLFIITNISDNFKYSQTFYEEKDGIYLVKTEQNVDILFFFTKHAKIFYSEPVLQLKQPLKVGDSWRWEGTQVKNDDDTTSVIIIGKAIAEETLTLPAGKFETLKVEISVENLEGGTTIFTQWLAKDLGSIKMNVKISGQGILQLAMALLGYDEVDSELKEIKYLNKK